MYLFVIPQEKSITDTVVSLSLAFDILTSQFMSHIFW